MQFQKFAAGVAVAAVVVSAGVVQAQDAFTKKPAEVRAGTYTLDPEHSKITWFVNHLGFSTYAGQFAGATGTLTLDPKAPAASKLDVTVKADDVGTLNAALDKHLKSADFLDTAKFPTATFKATRIVVKGANEADIHGDLTLRGVTKPIVIAAEFNQAGVNPLDKRYTVGFDGEAKIRRSEFGIAYALPAVGDEVTLKIEAEFKAAS
ncbi:YceI family protein [Phenylobacterium sp. J426]|uniref:YceI family protein n=1 Tax=Phenylobacterium sp. J426 TaxID=2898439 RepID=UPI002151F815|nr:YceI family protein [Phenylobacterium sp. J426]MCR5874248.1 YceI family protein [Phenylobacterium sp. J426]